VPKTAEFTSGIGATGVQFVFAILHRKTRRNQFATRFLVALRMIGSIQAPDEGAESCVFCHYFPC
jgi:hypothetical protein